MTAGLPSRADTFYKILIMRNDVYDPRIAVFIAVHRTCVDFKRHVTTMKRVQ